MLHGTVSEILQIKPAVVRLSRERTGVRGMTVKRTKLCYWIAWPAKPGVQSSNTSQVRFTVISHTPGRSRFLHIHTVSKRNWEGACLMNLTQQSYLLFWICYVFYCVAKSWCMLFKGRDMATPWRTLLLLRWYDCSALWRRAVWARIVT